MHGCIGASSLAHAKVAWHHPKVSERFPGALAEKGIGLVAFDAQLAWDRLGFSLRLFFTHIFQQVRITKTLTRTCANYIQLLAVLSCAFQLRFVICPTATPRSYENASCSRDPPFPTKPSSILVSAVVTGNRRVQPSGPWIRFSYLAQCFPRGCLREGRHQTKHVLAPRARIRVPP